MASINISRPVRKWRREDMLMHTGGVTLGEVRRWLDRMADIHEYPDDTVLYVGTDENLDAEQEQPLGFVRMWRWFRSDEKPPEP